MPLYADCICAWISPPLSAISSVIPSCALFSSSLTASRSPSESSPPFSACTTATGSPAISMTTVTRPSAPIDFAVNDESTDPCDGAARNRDDGSSSGVAA